ncbi:hypothetical protein VTJ49DRAFT_7287 [Mycothermus thermophilus]|uniref:Uncharacterized protein n=1 Tax=Humicola insolens TaxID=85995 RepID=A0ABR3VHG1_HUMIN
MLSEAARRNLSIRPDRSPHLPEDSLRSTVGHAHRSALETPSSSVYPSYSGSTLVGDHWSPYYGPPSDNDQPSGNTSRHSLGGNNNGRRRSASPPFSPRSISNSAIHRSYRVSRESSTNRQRTFSSRPSISPRDRLGERGGAALYNNVDGNGSSRRNNDVDLSRTLDRAITTFQDFIGEMEQIGNTMQQQRAMVEFIERWGLSRMGSHTALCAVSKLALATAEAVGGLDDEIREFHLDMGDA